jgi:predicted ATP-dependent endonuclease of OLD family
MHTVKLHKCYKTMKANRVNISGIKSHYQTSCSLEKYTVLVGQNNSGKSNLLFALRWLLGEIKLSVENINSITESQNTSEISMEIEFLFDENEVSPTCLQDIVEQGRFWLVGSVKISDLKKKDLSPSYQVKNDHGTIKPLKAAELKSFIGQIIYIPAIRSLSDEVKLTSSSSITKLISKYVVERVKNEDQKSNRYNKVVSAIQNLSEYINDGEDSAFNQLKSSLANYMLDYPDVEIGFELTPLDADELIKSCFTPYTKVFGSNKSLDLDSQGMGFQRSLVFSLLCNIADLNHSDTSSKYTLYLIEEPEMFLHPNHQSHFRNKLKELSKSQNTQIVITSHSPYFLSNVDDYSEIKRLSFSNQKSLLMEISREKIIEICQLNGRKMAIAKNIVRTDPITRVVLHRQAREIAEADELRYLLWIDPNRANAFLSQKVILVEGSTEKAVFSFLFNNINGCFYNDKRKTDVMVIDVTGKFHFYKFVRLLYQLGISVWVVYDGDNDKEERNKISHKALNKYIKRLKIKGEIVDCCRLDPDLEGSFGLVKDHNTVDVSIYQNLQSNTVNCLSSNGYSTLTTFISGVLNHK